MNIYKFKAEIKSKSRGSVRRYTLEELESMRVKKSNECDGFTEKIFLEYME